MGTKTDSVEGTISRFLSQMDDGTIACTLCAHGCRLEDGQRGRCRVRARRGDELLSLVYGRIVAENIDPIEKKPIFHLLPGSLSYSIATPGCNFRCLHCQNASISQISVETDLSRSGIVVNPAEVVRRAVAAGCSSISYTYVEPTVFFEFAYDCCLAARERGLHNVFVSNGYMSAEVVHSLSTVLSVINIDLKSFNNAFYKKVCGATLQPVLDTIRLFREHGVWVEVTTLLIPGVNDSDEEIGQIASFLDSVDRDIPWHVTGFYPAHKMMDIGPTPAGSLLRAQQIGKEKGLNYVYAGNRPLAGGENSHCPSCGLVVISRRGFQVTQNKLKSGRCPECNVKIPGIWV